MSTKCFTRSIAAAGVLFLCPGLVLAAAYSLTVAGEQLEFAAQPEKGYVVKLAERPGGITALNGVAIPDGDDPRPLGGLQRRDIWTVENEGPAARNEETVRSLRAGGQVAYAAALFSSSGETVVIIPEIVIRVKPGTDTGQVKALCEKAGCTIIKPMEFTIQEYLLQVLGPDAEAVFAAVEQLSQAPEVEWACPNTAFQPKLADQVAPVGAVAEQGLCVASAAEDPNTPGVFPNDPYFPMQWHLYNTGQSGGTPGADIRAPEAWEITTGDPNIVVAVIDSGVDSNHPDLVNNLIPGYDFLENDTQPDPSLDRYLEAHGMACAGLIAAQGNNGVGVTGVAWNCRIMPVRITGSGPDGKGSWCTEADTATAIRWAAAHEADILSNSWAWEETPTPILHSGIVDVTKPGGLGRDGKGCVVLFCIGNQGKAGAWYPQRYPEVITVGATDHNDQRTFYSSYGTDLHIMAPGGGGVQTQDEEEYERLSTDLLWTTDIVGDAGFSRFNENTDLLDYTEKMSGTSGAAPIAAGVAALILSIEPNLTGDEVRHFLERSAKDLGDPGRDDYYGWGRVDARAALDMVLAYRCDLNKDWKVDGKDLAILNAAIDANDLSADIAPAAKRDGVVDANDLELLTRYLGTAIPELGLLAHWKLDETEGLIAHDSAGQNDATVVGTPLWQPQGGKVGGALQLDGVDDYVSTGYVLDPSAGSFSVFAWIKGGTPGRVILSQADGANWLRLAGKPGMMTSLTTELKTPLVGTALSSPAMMTNSEWYRVGLVREGTSRILYVNDVEVARDTQTSLPGSLKGLYLGAGSTMTPASFWKGLLDDVRLYDRAVKP